MTRISLLIFSLLLSIVFCQEENATPRKSNLVSQILDKTLTQLFEQLSTNNLTVPKIDLGENVGSFSDVELAMWGETSKTIDGLKNWGFKLKTGIPQIALGGYYDVKHLDVPGLFPVYGKGNFRINLEGLSIELNLDPKMNFTNGKFVFEFPVVNVLLEKSEVQFENLMNDPSVADFLNELLSNLVPDLLKVLVRPLLEVLDPVISHYGNGIIDCLKKEGLTGKLNECIENLFKKPVVIEEFLPKLVSVVNRQ